MYSDKRLSEDEGEGSDDNEENKLEELQTERLVFFLFKRINMWYRKSENFGHGFILAPKYEVPKLNTPKYVTLQKLTAKI